MEFNWDTAKATSNKRKHGITFEEAASVFGDAKMKLRFDEEHSNGEERFLAIGRSNRGRLLLVSHVYRGSQVRIISASKNAATPGE